MRLFLKNICWFFLPLVIIAVVAELTLRHIPNDYSHKKKYLDRNATKIKVLILGNSHCYYGVDPKYLHLESFNAAYVSQSFNFDLAIINKYANSWDSLKYIVLPVDYFSLYTTLEAGIESWRVKNYDIYYGIQLANNLETKTEIFSNRPINNFIRLAGYYYKHHNAITCTDLGWGTKNKSSLKYDLEVFGKSAAKRHLAPNDHYLKRNIQTLRQVVAFAEKRNIKLLLFSSPAYKTYVEKLDSNQLNTTTRAVTTIMQQHKKTVAYFNWLTNSEFLETDFYDADHLNNIGAKKLTLKIDSVLCRQGQE